MKIASALTELGSVKPIILETIINEYGKVEYISNSVEEIIKVDTKFESFINKLAT